MSYREKQEGIFARICVSKSLEEKTVKYLLDYRFGLNGEVGFTRTGDH